MAKFIKFSDLTYFGNQFAAKIKEGFVKKEAGKGLSTNDYDNDSKAKLDGITVVSATAGTYRSVTIDEQGNVTAGTNPTTLEGYGITEVAASTLTGTISIDRLPHGALERCVVVADDDARFALTADDVQKGDTVKVTATSKMYFIVDDEKLSEEAGYEIYTAGSATSVPWTGVTGVPTQIQTIEDATEEEIATIVNQAFAEEQEPNNDPEQGVGE